MIKLFLDYENSDTQNRESLTKQIEEFLLGQYVGRVGMNETLIENVNIKLFIDPIKNSFQTVSKNYLEFYKKMRNMELFKLPIKNNLKVIYRLNESRVLSFILIIRRERR